MTYSDLHSLQPSVGPLWRFDTDNRSRALSAFERLKQLTPRQRQVLEGMVDGLLNKQIAAFLRIDEKTVKMHRQHLIKALQVGSSAAAIRIAVEASFVQV